MAPLSLVRPIPYPLFTLLRLSISLCSGNNTQTFSFKEVETSNSKNGNSSAAVWIRPKERHRRFFEAAILVKIKNGSTVRSKFEHGVLPKIYPTVLTHRTKTNFVCAPYIRTFLRVVRSERNVLERCCTGLGAR